MSSIVYTTASPRIALVTGGSRGLGRSTVLSLAELGVPSVFTYHSNQARADEVVSQVEQRGSRALALALDTGNASSFDAFVVRLREALPLLGSDRIDFLVNNAGTSYHQPIESTPEAELDRLYAVHFKGVFLLTQKLLGLLRDGGRVVNVSSGLTRFSLPGSAAYASMKGAVEVFTRYLARELGARGIAANTVAPGAIETDFSGGMVRDNPELNRFVAGSTALGRAGVPEDIGPLIASLLMSSHRWVNGQRIEASGGMFV